MDGDISVQSTFGKGSCFCVTLPYTPTEAPSQTKQDLLYTSQFIELDDTEEHEEQQIDNGRRILIV